LPTVAALHHADHLDARNPKFGAGRLTHCVPGGKVCKQMLSRAVSYDGKLASSADAPSRPSLTPIVDPDKLFDVCCEHSSKHKTKGCDRVTNLRVYFFAAWSLSGLALSGSMGTANAQDAALGEKVFLKCKACHQIGEGAKNAVGPVLNGVVGRKAGTYPDYSYSDANKNSGITWDEATLKEYLKNPRAKVPGTKMIFPGLTKDDDINNVLAYLKQFGADGKKS
jgi:cytochrome c